MSFSHRTCEPTGEQVKALAIRLAELSAPWDSLAPTTQNRYLIEARAAYEHIAKEQERPKSDAPQMWQIIGSIESAFGVVSYGDNGERLRDAIRAHIAKVDRIEERLGAMMERPPRGCGCGR